MFFTEPKFHKINSTKQLIKDAQDMQTNQDSPRAKKVQENQKLEQQSFKSVKQLIKEVNGLELQTNLDSPRTKRALDSLKLDKQSFRRKNKFELTYDFELRKLQYNEKDLHNEYVSYLERLIAQYNILHEARKEVKAWALKKQIEEDEMKGYKWPQPYFVTKGKQKEPYEIETVEDKMQKIEKERVREMEITDSVTKVAILEELDKRRTNLTLVERGERSTLSRQSRLLEKKQKALEFNEKVSKTLQGHKQEEKQKLNAAFHKSKSFQEKLNERDNDAKQKKLQQIQELANRNKENEEEAAKRRSLLGHKYESLEQRRFLNDLKLEQRRQQSAENAARERQAKSQNYENKLFMVQQKSLMNKQEFENGLYTSYGARMLKIEEKCKKRDEDVSKISKELRGVYISRQEKHKRLLQKQNVEQHEKMQELEEKKQLKEEIRKELKQRKELELQQLKEKKNENLKYHLQQVEIHREQRQKVGDYLKHKQMKAAEKIANKKDDQDKLLAFSTQSKQRLEQTNLLRLNELPLLKYATSTQLLEKIKDLVDEEEYQWLLTNYQPILMENQQQKMISSAKSSHAFNRRSIPSQTQQQL